MKVGDIDPASFRLPLLPSDCDDQKEVGEDCDFEDHLWRKGGRTIGGTARSSAIGTGCGRRKKVCGAEVRTESHSESTSWVTEAKGLLGSLRRRVTAPKRSTDVRSSEVQSGGFGSFAQPKSPSSVVQSKTRSSLLLSTKVGIICIILSAILTYLLYAYETERALAARRNVIPAEHDLTSVGIEATRQNFSVTSVPALLTTNTPSPTPSLQLVAATPIPAAGY
jgi:hypothetical protein